MKMMMRFLTSVLLLVAVGANTMAQKLDEERMRRDVEVAKNVLSTLIKQQVASQQSFFMLDIRSSYQAGYGVTFSLPADYTTPIMLTGSDMATSLSGGNGTFNVEIWGDDENGPGSFARHSGTLDNGAVTINGRPGTGGDVAVGTEPNAKSSSAYSLQEKARERKQNSMDSLREVYNTKVIDAAKTFIVDYGDMITQLGTQEKIIVTNQGGVQPRLWVNQYFNAPKRSHLSIEASKADLTQYRQGKLNRDQMMQKITVVNTETVETSEPDLELLSSIFSRLYVEDLSSTYFTDDNVYYERLKDYGAVFYMHVFSSIEIEYRRFVMPTLKLENVDLSTRNKKTAEIFPKFDQSIKENILEYGRTVRSLKDTEQLVFQVKITKCPECGIPAGVEYSVKAGVLKDYGAGKLDKNAAINKIVVKKGEKQ